MTLHEKHFVKRKIKNDPFYTVTDASHANPNNPNDPKTPSNVKSTPSKSDLIELLKTKNNDGETLIN